MEKSLDLNYQNELKGILAPYGCLDQLGMVAKVGNGKNPPLNRGILLNEYVHGPIVEGPDLS